MNRVKITEPIEGYVERSEGFLFGWEWGLYEVPVNRGLAVDGWAPFKWLAWLMVMRAKHQARTYGFRP